MGKETVKVSKTKSVPQAKKGEVATQPETFGMLFEPLASVRRDIDRFFEGLAPSFPRGIEFDPFRHMGSMFGLNRGDLTPHVEVTEQDKTFEISAELPRNCSLRRARWIMLSTVPRDRPVRSAISCAV